MRSSIVVVSLGWVESSRANLGSPESSSGDSGIALVSFLFSITLLYFILPFTSLSIYFQYLLSTILYLL
jgi:hypothetical protein